MTIERGGASAGAGAKAGRFLGSLKDALRAASRDDVPPPPENYVAQIEVIAPPPFSPAMSAAAAARQARGLPVTDIEERHIEANEPPTTRVVRGAQPVAQTQRTQLVRGRQKITRGTFVQDPVVGFLVIVGGPGLGASRAIFEGNNTIGRTAANRITLDFGDDSISADAQAYLRYDSTDRSFLFVPNLAKTNVVSVNDKRPAGAVELKSMDVITLGRTQVAFVPFCGPEFDWSEISETKDE